ncbi:hypothetical protein AGMMS49975_28470 [Clostridia bacterium]|nr:hypothetical protein AGMMS49975_28470 [Clostridia bacterium]
MDIQKYLDTEDKFHMLSKEEQVYISGVIDAFILKKQAVKELSEQSTA